MPVQAWKKRNALQRVRREYKTAAEVLESSAASGGGAAAAPAMTIVDMRGPQTRVVSNLEHLDMKDVSRVSSPSSAKTARLDREVQ